jgi:hypothetical protein
MRARPLSTVRILPALKRLLIDVLMKSAREYREMAPNAGFRAVYPKGPCNILEYQ